jgi:hypothetical protein
MELVDAVQEIAMQETDTSWLSPEYAEILKEQETIRYGTSDDAMIVDVAQHNATSLKYCHYG